VDISNVLRLARNYEQSGAEFYRGQESKIQDSLAKKTFQWLSKMEQSHVEFIESWLKNATPPEKPEDLPGQSTPDFFTEELKRQKLSSHPPKGDLADISILRMALLVEKDFVQFYEHAASLSTDPKEKKLFEVLRDWEKGHVELMKTLLERAFNQNRIDVGLYPGW